MGVGGAFDVLMGVPKRTPKLGTKLGGKVFLFIILLAILFLSG